MTTSDHPILRGTLEAYFETGTEGVLWSFMDNANKGYDALHVLKPSDHLKVFAKDGTIAWEGDIDLEYERERQPRPFNPEFLQQVDHTSGMWVHGFQVGMEPSVWARMFHDELVAEWRGKV